MACVCIIPSKVLFVGVGKMGEDGQKAQTYSYK